jgi:cobalt-zinc-cadmium efflux system membrane fusion protein
MDPNAGGKVQATQAGRLLAPPNGLPALGQRVSARSGTGLCGAGCRRAWNARARPRRSPSFAPASGLAEKRLARLQELSDTVPRREIEAAQSELASLTASASRHWVPVSAAAKRWFRRSAGVIASANALAGQVVDARDLVFEVVDPKRLRVEALAYDTELARDVGKAYLAGSGQRQALSFLGAAGSLRDQALPLQFALVDSKMQLAVGQPTKVVVQTRSSVEALAVPAAALAKNPANQTIVWVKAAPERFVPKVVQATPLDGSSVAVTHGLQDGELVVVEGATLVNQIR